MALDRNNDRRGSRADAPNTRFMTPPGRMSFVSLLEPTKNEQSGEYKYEVTMLFPPGTDLRAVRNALYDAGDHFFKGKDWPRGARLPSDVMYDAGEKDYAGYEKGWTAFKLSSKDAPGIVDASKIEVTDAREIYAGRWARVTGSAYAYDNKSKGVALGLNNVQLLQHDETFSGRPRANDEFDNKYQDDVENSNRERGGRDDRRDRDDDRGRDNRRDDRDDGRDQGRGRDGDRDRGGRGRDDDGASRGRDDRRDNGNRGRDDRDRQGSNSRGREDDGRSGRDAPRGRDGERMDRDSERDRPRNDTRDRDEDRGRSSGRDRNDTWDADDRDTRGSSRGRDDDRRGNGRDREDERVSRDDDRVSRGDDRRGSREYDRGGSGNRGRDDDDRGARGGSRSRDDDDRWN